VVILKRVPNEFPDMLIYFLKTRGNFIFYNVANKNEKNF